MRIKKSFLVLQCNATALHTLFEIMAIIIGIEFRILGGSFTVLSRYLINLINNTIMQNLSLTKQCRNFIERAIDNGDIKVIDYDALNEAIHDFCLANNLLEIASVYEREIIPNYGFINNIDGLTYDDNSEPLEIGENVYILEISEDGEQCLIESLKTGIEHYINSDRIQNF